ncbi:MULTISPECIES: phosphopantetheine-binding protein [Streptomyces]|uniref:phosphopantetheine-binding protein n=1 Tax=Streptomyces TaxID=1883 RepID=UPI000AF0C844|nr:MULTISPECIES: phosphopantetheine-binding protein [Streptomyces]
MINETLVFETLRDTTLEVVPELTAEQFRADECLADLGCNSIDRADIITMAMDRLGVVVPIGEVHSGLKVRDLVGLFAKHS